MAEETNNPQNVTIAKTKVSGYLWWAPYGTTLPTDSDTKLDPAFKLGGFVGEDGVTNTTETETTEVKDMGGNTVMKIISSYAESYQFVLIEALRAESAKIRYGSDAVEGEDGQLTIKHKMPSGESLSIVIEVIMTGEKKDRIVIGNASRSEFGDRQFHSTDVVGYDVTMSANADTRLGDGVTSVEYIGIAAAREQAAVETQEEQA